MVRDQEPIKVVSMEALFRGQFEPVPTWILLTGEEWERATARIDERVEAPPHDVEVYGIALPTGDVIVVPILRGRYAIPTLSEGVVTFNGPGPGPTCTAALRNVDGDLSFSCTGTCSIGKYCQPYKLTTSFGSSYSCACM